MSASNGSITAVREAAEELLMKASTPGLRESGLFPGGITRIAISVRSGDAEITVDVEGPPAPDVAEFDPDELWDEDDDDLEEYPKSLPPAD